MTVLAQSRSESLRQRHITHTTILRSGEFTSVHCSATISPHRSPASPPSKTMRCVRQPLVRASSTGRSYASKSWNAATGLVIGSSLIVHGIKGKLLESVTLQQQAANNTKE